MIKDISIQRKISGQAQAALILND